MEEIFGFIEKITFQNDETGFTVAQLQQRGKKSLVCIVGIMPGARAGESIRCRGNWKTHLFHGKQFEVKDCKMEAPADVEAIQKYLGSGLIPGIGPTYAKRIVDFFGIDTLAVIDRDPKSLKDVPGIGAKRVEQIAACWGEQRSIREVMIFLQGHKVSPAYAHKIFRAYKEKSIQIVNENPYRLAREINGIGFKTADAIAANLGIEKHSPKRIESGIEYVLSELSGNGHVCYPLDRFQVEAATMLEVDVPLVQTSVEAIKKDDRIQVEEIFYEGALRSFIWTKSLYISELGIAREIQSLQRTPGCLRQIDIPKALDWVQETLKIQLAENQKKAVALAMQEKFLIITGGPGTGKSTITNAILTITGKLTPSILLAAPTGRAAKRMTEICKRKASTIHSLLSYDFKAGGFRKNRENPLECDFIIVDEASMIDTYLMYSLLKAIPRQARVVFVGDVNQLPSVGPGNVLKDLIASNAVPVVQLTEIFRQAAGSKIITNAHRINQGMMPEIQNSSDSDFYFVDEEDPEKILQTIVAFVTQRLPKKYGFHPANDIQVLAPMRKGVIGTENLNTVLQEKFHPGKEGIYRAGRKFFENDKVMQIRNDYKKEVFNGDIGYISEINESAQTMTVVFDQKEVLYMFSELDDLVLAYAVSVHKYQGSECRCIIMPVHTTHFKLLLRNLLYTGVTRGKSIVILIGTRKALSIAVRNDEVLLRYTGLQQSLLQQLYGQRLQ
jgi:exodeoxyribonuclease V alpha subunit